MNAEEIKPTSCGLEIITQTVRVGVFLSLSQTGPQTWFRPPTLPAQPLLAAPVGHRIGSPRHQRVNPCFTAAETQKRGRESCRLVEREEGMEEYDQI